ncbi:MAG: hypothetical protein JXA15_06865 [Spirochaetales bacterium]|nr:hypothetical protein [Spirochaetales bacterium]
MSDGDEQTHLMRYDRSSRLSRASADVRWLSSLDPSKRPGVLGALVATRSLRFIAFAAILAAISFGIVSFALGDKARANLAGSVWTLSALPHQGDAFATVLRTGKTDAVAGLPLSIELGASGLTSRAALEAFTDAERSQEFYLVLRGAGKSDRLTARIVLEGESIELSADLRRSGAP